MRSFHSQSTTTIVYCNCKSSIVCLIDFMFSQVQDKFWALQPNAQLVRSLVIFQRRLMSFWDIIVHGVGCLRFWVMMFCAAKISLLQMQSTRPIVIFPWHTWICVFSTIDNVVAESIFSYDNLCRPCSGWRFIWPFHIPSSSFRLTFTISWSHFVGQQDDLD